MRLLVSREKNIKVFFFFKAVHREMFGTESTAFLVQYDCTMAVHGHCSLGKATAVPTFTDSYFLGNFTDS
jgi:hypothetical protein